MKAWKRILTIGLSAVMAAGMTAGCAANAGTNESESAAVKAGTNESESGAVNTKPSESKSDSTAAQTTGEKKGVMPTVVWWTVGGTVPSDFDKSMDTINEYLVDKLHIKLDLKVAGYGNYQDKMNTIINSGEYYDMMFVNNTDYGKYVGLGAFDNITDKVQSVTPDLYHLIPEELWNGVRLNTNVYSVPTYKDSSLTQFFCFDDQYVQKYHIDVNAIKTMEDLDAPFKAMKAGEGKGFYPLQMTQGSHGFDYGYDGLAGGLGVIGVKYDDTNRKVVDILEQPDYIAQLKLLHKWYMEGIINPDANVVTEDSKKLPFFSAQGWPSAVSNWQTLYGVKKYDAVKVFGPVYSTESIQGSMNAISSGSKYKDQCLLLLQLVNTDSKLRDMLAYGIEGRDFRYVGDGIIKKLSDTWPLAAYTQGTFFDMSVTDDTNPQQWKEVEKQNEEATPSTCLGFSLDITNIQSEMSNCQAVWDKYRFDLQTGASDPDKARLRCIKELKSAGLDTILSEAQKQINEYFK